MASLPDFVIIGAQRSGTTALFRYLSVHPSIYMPEQKELHFFDSGFDSGIDWYCDQFAGARDDQKVGEATPRYMSTAEAIDRMATVIPDAQLIAILRDPVDRAYSHYWMDKIRGRVDLTFEAYIKSEPSPLDVGRYVDRLRYVCQRFLRDQVLVLFYEDLRNDPRDTYAEACRFVGVEDTYVPASLGRTINRYVEFKSMRVRSWSKRLPLSLRPAKRVIDRLNTRTNISYPPMRPDTRAWLAERFSDSNAELAIWLGREIPDWTAPPQDGQHTPLSTGPSESR